MLRQRQHNVQQQNALVEKTIRENAIAWRARGVPEALRSLENAEALTG